MADVGIYEETAITTQNRGRLIVMLYDGAIKFLKQAIMALETGDFEGKGRYITKAQEIVLELNTILDMEAGGEISRNLRQLYHFIRGHLNVASTMCDSGMIQEVIEILEDLNQGWKSISR